MLAVLFYVIHMINKIVFEKSNFGV